MSDDRPVLAVVSNYARPDNINLWRRVADEIPEIRVITAWVYSHWEFKWAQGAPPPQINFRSFAEPGEGAVDYWRRPLQSWRKGGRIIDYMKENGVSAVVCHGYSSLGSLHIIRWCRQNGIPLFIRADSNIRGDQPRTPFRKVVKRPIVSSVVRRCTGFMAAGELGQRYFEKYGARPEQIFWVTFEPDWDLFLEVDPARVDAFRVEKGLPAGRRYLLFNGRLAAVKRVDLLFDAFARIADERPDWDLVIVGQGPLEDELRTRLPEALRARVRWLGFCQMDEMAIVYHCCDVNVLPSAYEPWGVVVLEAMATGEVVVSSDVVAAAYELVDDKVNGRLFRSGSVDSLTDALRDVTDAAVHARYRAGLRAAVDRFRKRADPVDGVRAALRFAGVLPEGSGG